MRRSEVVFQEDLMAAVSGFHCDGPAPTRAESRVGNCCDEDVIRTVGGDSLTEDLLDESTAESCVGVLLGGRIVSVQPGLPQKIGLRKAAAIY
jgi:hypothetical protein